MSDISRTEAEDFVREILRQEVLDGPRVVMPAWTRKEPEGWIIQAGTNESAAVLRAAPR